jgi:hypothetical protein
MSVERTNFKSIICRLIALVSVCAGTAFPADFRYFPLNLNSRWTLGNGFSPATSLKVTEESYVADERRVTLNLNTSSWQVNYLLVVKADGVYLDGFLVDSRTIRFPMPAPLFMAAAIPGQALATSFGSVTLVTDHAAIRDRVGRNWTARQYRIQWQGGGVEDWFLGQNMGPVKYLDDPAGFVLESATLTPPRIAPVPQYQDSPCAPFGAMVNPAANESYNEATILNQLGTISAIGGSLLAYDARWSDLEPTRNVYDFKELTRQIQHAASLNMNVLFTIRTIDTATLALPSYLGGRRLDDTLVLSRFQALLQRLAPLLTARVKWVHLANEVDVYLLANPAAITQYSKFFDTGYRTLKALKPSISIGSIHAYQTFRSDNSAFLAVGGMGDHAAFSYYPLGAGYQVLPVSRVAPDFAEMLAAAGTRKLVITETGYPSSTADSSSQAQQAAFYSKLFAQVANAGSRVGALNFFFINDVAQDLAMSWAPYYGASGNIAFAEYLSSLGMFDSTRHAKQSWTTFSTAASGLRVSGCRAPALP